VLSGVSLNDAGVNSMAKQMNRRFLLPTRWQQCYQVLTVITFSEELLL